MQQLLAQEFNLASRPFHDPEISKRDLFTNRNQFDPIDSLHSTAICHRSAWLAAHAVPATTVATVASTQPSYRAAVVGVPPRY